MQSFAGHGVNTPWMAIPPPHWQPTKAMWTPVGSGIPATAAYPLSAPTQSFLGHASRPLSVGDAAAGVGVQTSPYTPVWQAGGPLVGQPYQAYMSFTSVSTAGAGMATAPWHVPPSEGAPRLGSMSGKKNRNLGLQSWGLGRARWRSAVQRCVICCRERCLLRHDLDMCACTSIM